ncbi:serine hydrolase domain-containing protein [Flagellimonas meridianipacifica]|uniref:CubicO group peptidase (Beta-lactamase class C family) n=1 Tax=Flagellimonas meridianipacifica TaxID=1080225 RepID=A0A2T0MAT6_9FLAO|nr:serine hydrolase [Allomuricauda pacifica]PRX54627.1 CubicO group peptidase (beta-lactamase class C family) [Allomuricauda pacifica]
MKKVTIFAFTLIGVLSLQAQTFPNKEWSYQQDPDLDGWNTNKSKKFHRYLTDSTYITGFLVIHKGKIVFEYGDTYENSYIASCRKSVLALLMGKYVDDGKIDLNKNLDELGMEDVNTLLPVEKKATIKDLISSRSGIYIKGSNKGDYSEYSPKRGTKEPGKFWLYNNWDFNVSGAIFEQETGKNIYDEVQSQLAETLEMEHWNRQLQKKYGDERVSKFPAYHMWFSTRDMARIGLLMLRDGKWKSKQVISESWIKEVLKERTSYQEINHNVPIHENLDTDFAYGYMWWLWKNVEDKRLENGYSALGALGQSITVFPKIDVVIAFKTKSTYGRFNSLQAQVGVLKKAVRIYERTN